jgi:hypothetical protein
MLPFDDVTLLRRVVPAGSGLFYGDRLAYTDMQGRRRTLLSYQSALLKGPKIYSSGKGYYSFYQYQKPAVVNYPLFYYSEEFNVRDFVLMSCNSSLNLPPTHSNRLPTAAAPSCSNVADGGTFVGGSTAVIFSSTRCRAVGAAVLPPGPGAGVVNSGAIVPLETCAPEYVARYTTDGTHPATSATAKAYTRPLVLHATTVFRAVMTVHGAARPLVHNATFTLR